MKKTLDILNKQKHKNIGEKYILHVGKDVERLFNKTVIAGNNKEEFFDCVEIIFDGTIEEWKHMPKGSKYLVDDIDSWGSYYYHNDERNYRPDEEYIPWIIGYKKIVVHCVDGDYDYDPEEDENNPAESHTIERDLWKKIREY